MALVRVDGQLVGARLVGKERLVGRHARQRRSGGSGAAAIGPEPCVKGKRAGVRAVPDQGASRA